MSCSLYLIKSKQIMDWMCFYAEHGEMCGVPDAVGYDTAVHARKFSSREAAQRYIDNEMPAWARTEHHPVSCGLWEAGSELAVLISSGAPIPDKLLQATPGRLRIWLR